MIKMMCFDICWFIVGLGEDPEIVNTSDLREALPQMIAVKTCQGQGSFVSLARSSLWVPPQKELMADGHASHSAYSVAILPAFLILPCHLGCDPKSRASIAMLNGGGSTGATKTEWEKLKVVHFSNPSNPLKSDTAPGLFRTPAPQGECLLPTLQPELRINQTASQHGVV